MENNTEKIFTDLKEEVSAYVELKLRLWKLVAIERTAGVLSSLSHGLILVLFAFFTVLFLFVALGFFLGDLFGSIALGFLIIGGIYFILTFAFVVAKERIRMRLANVFVRALQTSNDKDDNEEDRFTDSTRTTFGGETGDPVPMPGDGRKD